MNYANSQSAGGSQVRGAIAVGSSVPIVQSELSEERARLDGAVQNLGDALRELRDRLGPVVRPSNPVPASDSVGMASPGPSSDHGIFLANVRHSLDSMAVDMHDLLRRLAV